MAADFSEMDRRQNLERFVGFWGQRQKSPAPILFIRRAAKQISPHEPIHQTDGGVVLEQEAAGKLTNRDAFFRAEPPHGQQGLMLLGRQAGLSRGLFAKGKEAA